MFDCFDQSLVEEFEHVRTRFPKNHVAAGLFSFSLTGSLTDTLSHAHMSSLEHLPKFTCLKIQLLYAL